MRGEKSRRLWTLNRWASLADPLAVQREDAKQREDVDTDSRESGKNPKGDLEAAAEHLVDFAYNGHEALGVVVICGGEKRGDG